MCARQCCGSIETKDVSRQAFFLLNKVKNGVNDLNIPFSSPACMCGRESVYGSGFDMRI